MAELGFQMTEHSVAYIKLSKNAQSMAELGFQMPKQSVAYIKPSKNAQSMAELGFQMLEPSLAYVNLHNAQSIAETEMVVFYLGKILPLLIETYYFKHLE